MADASNTPRPPTGTLVRAFLDEGAVRLILVEATAPAEHTRVVHGLGPDAARLGAEALVAAALNAAHIKGEEKLTLQLQGERPRCAVYADVSTEGALRARVTPADLRLDRGRLHGVLVAIKSLGPRELYRGITEVSDSTIEQALSLHLTASAQVDDVLRIGVRQAEEGRVLQAGGLLLERLPEEPDHPSLDRESFEARYGWVREAEISHLLTQLAFGSLGDRPIQLLEHRALRWLCGCSRERIEAGLITLGAAILREMSAEDHGAEVHCNFCNQPYSFGEDELLVLAEACASPERVD